MGGGRSLEDLRTLKSDTALSSLLQQKMLPSTDAMGDWLRRTGAGEGLSGLSRLNRRGRRHEGQANRHYRPYAGC
jgi:hypothetical protein